MSLRAIQLYETAEQLGLNKGETDEIIRRLGREPTLTELSMLSVEWSEHCSYRRSRHHFSRFPRTGPAPVLVGEDAGGIVIDDLAVLFKIESHNHPSQVEPRHGAATGVGGIIRDIFGSGARPVAVLNSLRFGPLDDAANRRLFRGVVGGISWYGNAIGVPTVGGEVDFHPSYSGNCLVNVMCVGIAPKEALLTSKARPECAVMILGSQTGRDGIGGCSVLASQEMREALEKRPTVQVGDPYFGKCLIEATLEAATKNLFVAVKDMGAAGITCTTSEMSAAGGCGMEIDVAKIPARETGMEAWEFMMSESQERMLAAVRPADVEAVREIFHRWGLEAEVIGKTIQAPLVKIFSNGEQVASIPTEALVDPPKIFPDEKKPFPLKKSVTAPHINDWPDFVLRFLSQPSLAGKSWAWRQYDYMVQTNTVAGPGADAAVLRVKEKPWGIAVKMEGNGRYCQADPFTGAQYLVAEAARNLAVVGAVPLALTDGLNFGNPDKPEPYGEFTACVEGLAAACRELGLPVVSGNVSFYNESDRTRILPTPIIGMIGKVDDLTAIVPAGFQRAGDKIYLIGPRDPDLSGSLFLEFCGIESAGLPVLDWRVEKAAHDAVRKLLAARLVSSCHDVGEGGLLAALAECVTPGGIGAALTLRGDARELFGEPPSRIIVSIAPANVSRLETLLRDCKVPFEPIGETGGDTLAVPGYFEISVAKIADALNNTLDRLMA